MLPELIYREERSEDYILLIFLGAVSAFLGFGFASVLFPSQVDILSVIFGSIPLVYPLTRFFLEDEKDGRPHLPEIFVYGSVFIGEALGFLVLGLYFPEAFTTQLTLVGASGYATSAALFASILKNNLFVFTGIVVLSALIGSAGAFVLSWNASVLGVFFAHLIDKMPGRTSALFACSKSQLTTLGMQKPSFVCYLPHAVLEITGFIVAGVVGSLISASIYRKHFDRSTWENHLWFLASGVALILAAAALESGRVIVFVFGVGVLIATGYQVSQTFNSPDGDAG